MVYWRQYLENYLAKDLEARKPKKLPEQTVVYDPKTKGLKLQLWSEYVKVRLTTLARAGTELTREWASVRAKLKLLWTCMHQANISMRPYATMFYAANLKCMRT